MDTDGNLSNMNWDIPRISGDPLPISLQSGDRFFIVGSNGSGKSALIQHFVSGHQEPQHSTHFSPPTGLARLRKPQPHSVEPQTV